MPGYLNRKWRSNNDGSHELRVKISDSGVWETALEAWPSSNGKFAYTSVMMRIGMGYSGVAIIENDSVEAIKRELENKFGEWLEREAEKYSDMLAHYNELD